ncbi:MAG: antitoxin, partial [Betaproteobacteria bacterium]|nr:antitoxin [Betaproteobacteria bacterium]
MNRSHGQRGDSLRLTTMFAECLGTALLLCIVIGSGVMAESLAAGNHGVALIANTAASFWGLYVLIVLLGPVSGAHFNPLVSLIAAYKKDMKVSESLAYVASQFAGGFIGVALANLMFELPAFKASTHIRSGDHLYLSEVIATAGLIFIIFAALDQKREKKIPNLVACWIGAAYFFTSS